MLDELLKRVAVVGASGKMGRGISALLLQEIAATEALVHGSVGKGNYTLQLIDSNEKSFLPLKQYLHQHILKYAEKNIVRLRQWYRQNQTLISNEEIIQDFVDGALNLILIEEDVENVKDVNLIFEAIIENVNQKAQTFTQLKENNPQAFFFTNTSSIPIHVLDEQASLEHRIIGYHFYNPPVVQKLLEVVVPENVPEKLSQLSLELAKSMQKQVVIAKDVAGFIGNGLFIRELIYASKLAQELGAIHGYAEGVYIINQVTQEYLLRPMGIFQLADYVGLDICDSIIAIMRQYLPNSELQNLLIEWMLSSGNKGGQSLEGDQKPGFFTYEKQTPVAVYSLEHKNYISLNQLKVDGLLGFRPDVTWKKLQKDLNREKVLHEYFEKLLTSSDLGPELARKFLDHSKATAKELVDEGVARSFKDVDTVLQSGFYHLYGADYESI